jgi:hypothetical protein
VVGNFEGMMFFSEFTRMPTIIGTPIGKHFLFFPDLLRKFTVSIVIFRKPAMTGWTSRNTSVSAKDRFVASGAHLLLHFSVKEKRQIKADLPALW